MYNNLQLKKKSYALRRDILTMIYRAKTGHIGGDFSVCDILTILYNRYMQINPDNFTDKNHDRFILSKGHSVEALYSVLADKGFITKEELESYAMFGSVYIGHPNNKINGIEMNSGSLGHGLSVGVGMALAGKIDALPYRVYVVLGDGELAEGSVWEGIMSAGHYNLNNLIAVVDRNRLQISGSTEDVMAQNDLGARWQSFNWHVLYADGNNMDSLDEALTEAIKDKGKPTVIIANTIKGYGVSFIENRANWHHKVPNETEYKKAMEELNAKEAAIDE